MPTHLCFPINAPISTTLHLHPCRRVEHHLNKALAASLSKSSHPRVSQLLQSDTHGSLLHNLFRATHAWCTLHVAVRIHVLIHPYPLPLRRLDIYPYYPSLPYMHMDTSHTKLIIVNIYLPLSYLVAASPSTAFRLQTRQFTPLQRRHVEERSKPVPDVAVHNSIHFGSTLHLDLPIGEDSQPHDHKNSSLLYPNFIYGSIR